MALAQRMAISINVRLCTDPLFRDENAPAAVIIQKNLVSDDFLAAQRRAIYARLSQPHHWWNDVPVRHWAAAATMFMVLAGSAALYQRHRREVAEAKR